MVFDFLPNLPKATLDDRTYDDLIQECLQRIPRYCPEWSNYNPSDPGITLLELFSWLMEQMLTRFNQLPRQNYVLFLELLGIRLQPPNPAQTEITFYLVSDLPDTYTIPDGIEIATERLPDAESIVFSTDRPLTIARPQIQHVLHASIPEDTPHILRDRLTNWWTMAADGTWSGPELSLFGDRPDPGQCFYLVFAPDTHIDGNVIALTIKGQAATPTGINPDHPPRRWEAWNGRYWQSVLLEEADDETQGFSFRDLTRQGRDPAQGADIILHLPVHFPVAHFTAYQGRWLRCICTEAIGDQAPYSRSPRIVGIGSRSIGGTILATQGQVILNEVLGISDGNPGQVFQLQRPPVLARGEGEYLIVTPPGELPQTWQEVPDFSNSQPDDRHYLIDSLTGVLQLGPLVREPTQLLRETQYRAMLQTRDHLATISPAPSQERQYGAIPPRGSTLTMVRYRTGGGVKGNVQPGTITVMKSAVPYVGRIINHLPARNGSDAESLEQAAIRVPQMLRTRDRAVTPEDFETLAILGGQGAIARSRCLPADPKQPGTVELLLIPRTSLFGIEQGVGISPAELTLDAELHHQVLAYLDERRLLGVQVKCQEPEYIGVAVQTEVTLKPEYQNPTAQAEILQELETALYRFLNPIVGGVKGEGWPFGKPLYPSDVIALLQQFNTIQSLGAVQLFALRYQGERWVRGQPSTLIDPGIHGTLCSWSDPALNSSHIINIIQ
ncbi:MAG: putative baseplate assembly protein [Cyanobacteria bacterium J06592_8]